ncbi:MAG: hypothetical protein KTR21_09350 [Rhodobacteraceae bacterium]|nr:hypothetical protein [Paracoccaceae bacterium]
MHRISTAVPETIHSGMRKHDQRPHGDRMYAAISAGGGGGDRSGLT